MEVSDIKKILEALLFISERSLNFKDFKNVLEADCPDTSVLTSILNQLQEEYTKLDKPYEIRFIAGGWVFATKSEYSPWINKLLKDKIILKLSTSALETLAIVAYKQPITRGEIDEIRGVESSGVIDTLLERKLIKHVGRKEALGKPLLYGTTQGFLKHFGLVHLNELPPVDDNARRDTAEQDLPMNIDTSYHTQEKSVDDF